MKNFKIFAGAFAFAAIVGVNVWKALPNVQNSELCFENVEAFGQDGDVNVILTGKGVERPYIKVVVIDGRPRYYHIWVDCIGDNPSDCHPYSTYEDAMKEQ